MGSKYTTQVVSGYNSSPPPDDGSTVASNKITWNTTIKAKLADPILTLAQAVNSALLTFSDFSQNVVSSAYTTTGADHMKTIQVTGTTTISLGDATSMGAGYIVNVANYGTNTVTLTRITGADTLNGATKAITLTPGAAVTVKVIAAATGYQVIGSYNVMFDQTDPSKQITNSLSGLTTGTTRTVTWPDKNITVAGTVDITGGTLAGSFTTLAASGLISPAQTVGIAGTTTNNDVQAGSVGEYISSSVTGQTVATSAGNLTSISLTAGDWDIEAAAGTAGSSTATSFRLGISTTSATFTGNVGIDNLYSFLDSVNQVASGVIPRIRVSLSGTTTYYLVAQTTGASTSANVAARISARRVR